MGHFIQLHLLTSYPPANLNRDDLGRPKTAVMGGVSRLRISSQSLKRAWRTSSIFEETLSGSLGTRTKRLGIEIRNALVERKVSEKNARDWAKTIASQFGKLKKAKDDKSDEELSIEQLAHVSPSERNAVDRLVEVLAQEQREPSDDELKILRNPTEAVDIALFGRMLASSPKFNVDAAVQVAHAISVHRVVVEDDYFTAVDDLNPGDDDAGAGHIGELGFAAGLFYLYICVDSEMLLENLGDDLELKKKTLEALVEAVTKVAPKGKQASFASRAYASYVLAERGAQQPRSLAVSFLKPVDEDSEDFLGKAIESLEKQREQLDSAYGPCADDHCIVNTHAGEGNLKDLIDFVTK